jgi:hypothetical protein
MFWPTSPKWMCPDPFQIWITAYCTPDLPPLTVPVVRLVLSVHFLESRHLHLREYRLTVTLYGYRQQLQVSIVPTRRHEDGPGRPGVRTAIRTRDTEPEDFLRCCLFGRSGFVDAPSSDVLKRLSQHAETAPICVRCADSFARSGRTPIWPLMSRERALLVPIIFRLF